MPFAVKDNIDVAGLPTTAACPAFAYTAGATAPAVQRLLDAGAILVGKTNLDQLATGLVGTRSPYGACRNPFDRRYISGGSSSGSAVAVAAGLVSFALGTDTAGSGRVPAGFCNLVGVKPTRGLVSTRGVVPACRSLDCVSIFALCCDDGAVVLDVLAGFDPADPYSRPAGAAARPLRRLGMPQAGQLAFHGDDSYARLFDEACARLEAQGVELRPVDFGPLFEAAALLYQGPWIAERYLAAQALLEQDPTALLPVIREVVGRGRAVGGAEVFAGLHRLQALRRHLEAVLAEVDGLVVPTAPSIWTQAEVAEDPIGRNAALGTYTNFVNLLDLAALAVPAGWRADGLPFGITLIGPAFAEAALLELGGRFHAASGLRLGSSATPVPRARAGGGARARAHRARGLRRAYVGAAAQSRADPARRPAGRADPDGALLPPLCAAGRPAAAARAGARRGRGGDRGRALGIAARELRQLRRGRAGAARDRHADARGRPRGQGLPLRGPRGGGRDRHHPAGWLAALPRGSGELPPPAAGGGQR